MPSINIDDLTLGQVKEVAALAAGKEVAALAAGVVSAPASALPADIQFSIGRKVIIRTYSAGVWFGTLTKKCRNEVIIAQARRLWSWKAAESISLSAVAVHGITQSESRIPGPVEAIWLEAIEIIPCTDLAAKSIEEAPHDVAR